MDFNFVCLEGTFIVCTGENSDIRMYEHCTFVHMWGANSGIMLREL